MGDAAIRRLLAVCLEEGGMLRDLEPALQLLHRGLPDARLALLVPCEPGPSGQPQAECAALAATLPQVQEILYYPDDRDARALIDLVAEVRLRHFDAALIFTRAQVSPYLAAYVCYLAGVPVRLGQSCEFGGGVLSHRFPPSPAGSPPDAQFLALAGRALRELAADGPAPSETG